MATSKGSGCGPRTGPPGPAPTTSLGWRTDSPALGRAGPYDARTAGICSSVLPSVVLMVLLTAPYPSSPRHGPPSPGSPRRTQARLTGPDSTQPRLALPGRAGQGQARPCLADGWPSLAEPDLTTSHRAMAGQG